MTSPEACISGILQELRGVLEQHDIALHSVDGAGLAHYLVAEEDCEDGGINSQLFIGIEQGVAGTMICFSFQPRVEGSQEFVDLRFRDNGQCELEYSPTLTCPRLQLIPQIGKGVIAKRTADQLVRLIAETYGTIYRRKKATTH